MAPTALPDNLPDELQHEWSGETKVLQVSSRVDQDSAGEQAIFVTITLSDPPSDDDGWPVADVWRLRRTLRRVIQRVAPELEIPWYLVLRSEHPDEFPEDEYRVEADEEA